MSESLSSAGSLRTEIYRELASIRLVDPHTHINPHQPASSTLADILGYHYYTELAHAAGLDKSRIEEPSIGPRELVGRLVNGLEPIENTIQYSWLIDICRTFFGFEDDRLHAGNWESLYDRAESMMASADWANSVLRQSNVEAVFLTNDFDDALSGFDRETYIPCLRTDELVFHLANPEVRGRLAECSGIEIDGSLSSLRSALRQRFEHFVSHGARACAISLPPSFTPVPVSDGRAATAFEAILRDGLTCDAAHRDAIARRVFWTLAELCDEFGLPFDLMIGVNRGVYPGGVHQGRDLYDSRVSLIQYRELFNAFTNVKFPVSVLASVTNQELVSYAWIFPNVITSGHWWYSNTPSIIARDVAARLEAVPQTKQIAYYSDAYKLEFVRPKFDRYLHVLAGVLADQFVTDRNWGVERAVELGQRVLRDNVEMLFPVPPPLTPSADSEAGRWDDAVDEPENEVSQSTDDLGTVAGVGVAAVGGAMLDASGSRDDLGRGDDADDLETIWGDSEATLAPETSEAPVEIMAAAERSPDADAPSLDEDLSDVELLNAPELPEDLDMTLAEDFSATVIFDADESSAQADDFELEPEASPSLRDPREDDSSFDTQIGMPPPTDPLETLKKAGNAFSESAQDQRESVDVESSEAEWEDNADGLGEVMFEEPTSDASATVMEEINPVTLYDTIAMDDVEKSSPIDFSADEGSLSDWPTMVDESPGEPFEIELETPADDQPHDPLPDDAELGELDLDDVELIDFDSADSEADFETLIDPEPLDVGDLLGDDEASTPESMIRPLSGEGSFSADEETLQLTPDPETGEFTFPVGDADDDDEFDLTLFDTDKKE